MSVENDRIHEGFAQGLKDISNEISSVEDILDLDRRTSTLACYLYAQFFMFYRFVIIWYSTNKAKRALRSLNANFCDDIKGPVEEVKSVARLIDRRYGIKHGKVMVNMQRATNLGIGLILQRFDRMELAMEKMIIMAYNQKVESAAVRLLLGQAADKQRYQEQLRRIVEYNDSPNSPEKSPEIPMLEIGDCPQSVTGE